METFWIEIVLPVVVCWRMRRAGIELRSIVNIRRSGSASSSTAVTGGGWHTFVGEVVDIVVVGEGGGRFT